jgi:hypothetical protein
MRLLPKKKKKSVSAIRTPYIVYHLLKGGRKGKEKKRVNNRDRAQSMSHRANIFRKRGAQATTPAGIALCLGVISLLSAASSKSSDISSSKL